MEVLHVGVVLYDRRKHQPDSRVQVGDVGRLASGRLVARCRFDFADRTSAWSCRDYDPDETAETAPLCVAPLDFGRWQAEELERWPGRYRRLEPRDCERERVELAKFRSEWPYIASQLAAAIDLEASPAPADLFELGPVLWMNQVGGIDSDIDWRGFADRHASGSFGLYGKYDDAPVTEEELWTLSEQPISVANRAAIAARSGPVRSQFALRDERPHHAKPARPQLTVMDVLTVLSPRGPRSLMTARCVDAKP